MSLAPQELENSASRFAAEAIKLESQGARGMAITNYQRAIESLVKLIQLYPDNKLNRVYMERSAAYQNRIKALQMSHIDLEPIVYPSKRPDLFPLGWPRGILLYGPPGCGKTILAAATASEIDGYFINIDAASMMSKWLGEAEKNVAKVFAMARNYAEKEGLPVILFIDEVDSLLGNRSSEVGGEIRVKNQFLSEMDGIK